ncbi:hypothetical protein [Microbulbifer sp.]
MQTIRVWMIDAGAVLDKLIVEIASGSSDITSLERE